MDSLFSAAFRQIYDGLPQMQKDSIAYGRDQAKQAGETWQQTQERKNREAKERGLNAINEYDYELAKKHFPAAKDLVSSWTAPRGFRRV